MPEHPDIDLTVKLTKITGEHEKDRNLLRSQLIDKLLLEKAGTGNKELTSKYKYNVEKLFNGGYIYITRPVPLNKGFDFVIHVEDYIFINNKDNPKHEDIINDIKIKKEENMQHFQTLLSSIKKVFLCHDPNDLAIINEINFFKSGLSIEILLKVMKWLFIEQDVRYWNWSGKNMFMNAILEASEC